MNIVPLSWESPNLFLIQTLKWTLASLLFNSRNADADYRLGGIWTARTWTPEWFQLLYYHSPESYTSNGPMWHHYSANTTWRRPLVPLFKVVPSFDVSLGGFPSVKEGILPPSGVIGKFTWMSYLASWLWLLPCPTTAGSWDYILTLTAWSWRPIFENQKHLVFRLASAGHLRNYIMKLKAGSSHGIQWV